MSPAGSRQRCKRHSATAFPPPGRGFPPKVTTNQKRPRRSRKWPITLEVPAWNPPPQAVGTNSIRSSSEPIRMRSVAWPASSWARGVAQRGSGARRATRRQTPWYGGWPRAGAGGRPKWQWGAAGGANAAAPGRLCHLGVAPAALALPDSFFLEQPKCCTRVLRLVSPTCGLTRGHG